MWITIVEDDPNISEIEGYALKSSGYSVSVFDTAREFYSAIAERRPDLVILDVMLPDEDGLSILKKLRSRSDTKRVPILLVTAKTTEMDKVKGLDTGADDYLTKPFGVMELIARVKALIRRAGDEQSAIVIACAVGGDSSGVEITVICQIPVAYIKDLQLEGLPAGSGVAAQLHRLGEGELIARAVVGVGKLRFWVIRIISGIMDI